MDRAHSRAPKQRRSKESFDRVIQAASAILEDGGIAALTLAAVSRRSRVSIGSIYCRVDGKEALLREVQATVLPQMDAEFTALLNRARRRQLSLPELVPALVRELALHLRRHAALLAAFMQQGDRDPVVEQFGRKSYQKSLADFSQLLLEHRAEFKHPDPEQAASTCFNVVFSSLARYLGLNAGMPGHGGAGEGDWRQLVDDLGAMSRAFLTVDIGLPARTRSRTRPTAAR